MIFPKQKKNLYLLLHPFDGTENILRDWEIEGGNFSLFVSHS